jgi:hypothetical protein
LIIDTEKKPEGQFRNGANPGATDSVGISRFPALRGCALPLWAMVRSSTNLTDLSRYTRSSEARQTFQLNQADSLPVVLTEI